MKTIKLSEAKAHLGRYAREAARGEVIIITDHNREMARLTGQPDGLAGIRPKVGLMEGEARIAEDFDAPLSTFETDYYGS